MKPKLILLFALVLSGGLFGCSTTETKIFNTASDDGLPEVINYLGRFYSVRSSADSWPALVRQVKPAFAWNGCDMMWIQYGSNGQPRFILDQAYCYQATNQPLQWILVKVEKFDHDYTNDEAWLMDGAWRQFGNCNLRSEIPLQKSVPDAADNGDQGDYAVIKSANPHYGVVYEIGWQRNMSAGNGLADYGRRIYVWEDRADHWHFLGEGPEEGSERGDESEVESKVVWDNSPTNGLPFQIRFHDAETTYPYTAVAADDVDTNNPESVTICYDSALVAELPAKYQDIRPIPYLLAEKNDTFEKIVFRLGYFEPGWQYFSDEVKQQAEKKQILRAWRAVIIQLNPNLPLHGKIKEGTRVNLINPGELENHLIELDRQQDALLKAGQK